jgi:hypothetical protein
MDGPGSNLGRVNIFLFSTTSRPDLGFASYPLSTGGSFLGGKEAGL